VLEESSNWHSASIAEFHFREYRIQWEIQSSEIRRFAGFRSDLFGIFAVDIGSNVCGRLATMLFWPVCVRQHLSGSASNANYVISTAGSIGYNVNKWLDAHLHIRLNVPVLSKFDVRPAVPAWFTNADRRSRQSAGKTTVQPWFSDVFDLERRDA